MALDSVYWVFGPSMSVINLNDRVTTWSTRARDGLWSPAYQINSSEYPQQPGSVFNFIKTKERVINLQVEVRSDTHAGLLTALRDLTYRMNPENGIGYVEISTDGGISRRLNCRANGLTKVSERERTATVLLSWLANDPYWYSTTQISASYSQGAIAAFFPIFPISLGSSSTFADDTVVVEGDVETWPLWTITGAASDIYIENETTEKVIDLTGLTVPEYDWLAIDTRPGAKSLLMSGSHGIVTDVIEYLSLTSSLFPLVKGSNSILMRISSPTAGTQVTLDYTPRYLSA